MKNVILAMVVLSIATFAQQPTEQQTKESQQSQVTAAREAPPSAPSQTKSCVIVQHEGGHAFRNYMLLGVAGAVISKERYKVVESNVAGLKVGEKMHGDELQARTQGAKVIVLRKNKIELAEAREACNK